MVGRDGEVEAAVAVLRDLSRLRQLEAEVRRGETLAAAGRMAVGLAHEIRKRCAGYDVRVVEHATASSSDPDGIDVYE